MKINFLILEEKKELLIDKNMTFNEIKKKITNKYFKNKLDIEYINLEYISERPLREFGKYTIEWNLNKYIFLFRLEKTYLYLNLNKRLKQLGKCDVSLCCCLVPGISCLCFNLGKHRWVESGKRHSFI